MNPITTTIKAGGVDYTFRLPSTMDMIQIDLNALELRKGVIAGLRMAPDISENLSAFKILCVSPDNVDFGALPPHVTTKLGGGLWKWINSFSEPDGEGMEQS